MPRLYLVLLLLVLGVPVLAQPRPDPITEFLNASLQNLSVHTQDFNDHVTGINTVRPLDAVNLDSANIETTISNVLQFTQYLRAYLHTTDSMRTALTDSLALLKASDPNPDVQRSLDRFEASYKTDQTAWHDYVEALQEVYDNVLNALLFVKSTKHDLYNGGVRFASAADLKRYDEYMSKIGRLTTALQHARTVSQKATEAANKQLLALNAIHAQPHKHTKRKKE